MLGQLNHVAIAVPSLAQSIAFYRETLGAKISEPQSLSEHGVTVAFIDLGNTKLELLEPLGDQSPIRSFLEKNPQGGIHHICIETTDIQSAVSTLSNATIRILGGDQPKIGAHGKPVIFMHPKDTGGVLLELEQV